MERKPFEQRFTAMESEASKWVASWKDIQKYLAPTRGFFDGVPNDGKMIDHKVILDGHASRMLGILAAGMTEGMTSPSRPWFRLGFADADLASFYPVKEWLDVVQQRMADVYSKSNIYGVLNSVYYECGSFGTGAIILLEDFHDVVRGRNFTCGEYFLSVGSDGRVNGFARKYKATVGQLVGEFGLENVSNETKDSFNRGNVDGWVTCRHLIEVNDARIQDRADFRGKPWRSVYWEEGSLADTFLGVRGFEDFPLLAPRWSVSTTHQVYGHAPGWEALGDTRMLQAMQAKKLRALDKEIDPPVNVDSSDAQLFPGGINVVSPGAMGGAKAAYQIHPDLGAIELSIEKTKSGLSEYFYADLFRMISMGDGGAKTAREIIERHEEKLVMLGPVLERLESELLDPLIDRTFNIMMRMGLIPPPPQELAGQDIKVEYISMLAQAQKMVANTAIEQTVAFGGNLAAAYPEVKDVIDPDETLRNYADVNGVPSKIIRSREAVDDIRKRRAQAAAEAQAAQDTADTVQGAKVLSDTKIGQNSALDALLGTGAPA